MTPHSATCIIMQKSGAGLHTASACYWDSNTDRKCFALSCVFFLRVFSSSFSLVFACLSESPAVIQLSIRTIFRTMFDAQCMDSDVVYVLLSIFVASPDLRQLLGPVVEQGHALHCHCVCHASLSGIAPGVFECERRCSRHVIITLI